MTFGFGLFKIAFIVSIWGSLLERTVISSLYCLSGLLFNPDPALVCLPGLGPGLLLTPLAALGSPCLLPLQTLIQPTSLESGMEVIWLGFAQFPGVARRLSMLWLLFSCDVFTAQPVSTATVKKNLAACPCRQTYTTWVPVQSRTPRRESPSCSCQTRPNWMRPDLISRGLLGPVYFRGWILSN